MKEYARPTSDGAKRYYQIEKDPIHAVTSALVYNLGTRNLKLAARDYENLLVVIQARGLKGKDIRYAAQQLNALYRDSRNTDAMDIGNQAARYARLLPAPSDSRRKRHDGLGQVEFVEHRPLSDRNIQRSMGMSPGSMRSVSDFYGKKIAQQGAAIAKNYAIVRQGTIDGRYLFELVSLIGKDEAFDVMVLHGKTPDVLLTEFDSRKIGGKRVFVPTEIGAGLEELTAKSFRDSLAKSGFRLVHTTDGVEIYDFRSTKQLEDSKKFALE